MDWKVTLSDMDFDGREAEAVAEVLRSRWLTMGERTQAFEREAAAALGARHAFLVSNGTAALELALKALGVGPGEDVLLPSITFVACANAVVAVGARPVFVEIESADRPLVSPEDARARAGSAARVLMAVHYAGFPCRLPELAAFADGAGLALLEDAAHAPGAKLAGRALGAWGAAGCFSLFSNKNVAVGEGGLVVTGDDRLAEELRLLRSHGMTTLTLDRHRGHAADYDVVRAGHNFRPSEITAALASAQWAKLARMNERRRALTARYRAALAGTPGLALPFAAEPLEDAACHLMSVLLEDPARRAPLRESLKRAGIQTSAHYPPIHLFSYYRDRYGFRPGDLPVSEAFAARQVTLPLHSRMGDDEVDLVAEAVRKALA